MNTLKPLASLLVCAALLTPMMVGGHGGGLDSLGCHNDRKRGGYHCHRGPLAGQSFLSRTEAEKVLQASKNEQSTREKRRNSQTSAQGDQKSQQDAEERIVYITRTGARFHGPSCSSLRSSRIPISLKDARKRGYTACSRCGGR